MGLMGNDATSIEWLSTHPSHERRQAQLEDMLPDAISVREKCQVYYHANSKSTLKMMSMRFTSIVFFFDI